MRTAALVTVGKLKGMNTQGHQRNVRVSEMENIGIRQNVKVKQSHYRP
jgi:hypothetical protein